MLTPAQQLPFHEAEFSIAIPKACAQDTAAGDGKGWTPDNPTWGHCAVVALWVQNFYGGLLARVDLAGTPFAGQRSHYYNDTSNPLVGESAQDYTAVQFGGTINPFDLPSELRSRDYVISGGDTRARYARFGLRLLPLLLPNHKLFRDSQYRLCIEEALWSPCQKKGVGAVLISGGEVLCAAHNRTIPGLESLCTPTCIRFSIPSRTESMLGSCGHAEERVLWEAANLGLDLRQCEIFVAATTANGLPENRLFPEFTCLRCAVAMHYARLKAVNVAYHDEWIRQTPAEALASARAYALGRKTV